MPSKNFCTKEQQSWYGAGIQLFFNGSPAIQKLKETRELIWPQKKRLVKEEKRQTVGAHLLMLKQSQRGPHLTNFLLGICLKPKKEKIVGGGFTSHGRNLAWTQHWEKRQKSMQHDTTN